MTQLNRQRGKRAERMVASRMKGKRVGILGNEDVHHPLYSIEVKARARCAVVPWMEQCERNAGHGKIPLLVVHIHGTRHTDNLCVIRMKDLEDITGVFQNGQALTA